MPLPVLSIAEMRAWERATWAAGGLEAEVIEWVGRHLANCIRKLTNPGEFILLLAGRGNNGADTRAALPHLSTHAAEVLEVNQPAEALARLESALARAPVLVVDGLFGIGLNRWMCPPA
jgi:NAD(P)H-hydrate repair Nnr-like enzyme with NAD(P)H-hydrate epimerase domain